MIAAKCEKHGQVSCTICGMTQLTFYKTPVIESTLIDLQKEIKKLPRYYPDYYSGYDGYGCGSTMECGEDGEYIKLEDVLNLFSAKKEIR